VASPKQPRDVTLDKKRRHGRSSSLLGDSRVSQRKGCYLLVQSAFATKFLPCLLFFVLTLSSNQIVNTSTKAKREIGNFKDKKLTKIFD